MCAYCLSRNCWLNTEMYKSVISRRPGLLMASYSVTHLRKWSLVINQCTESCTYLRHSSNERRSKLLSVKIAMTRTVGCKRVIFWTPTRLSIANYHAPSLVTSSSFRFAFIVATSTQFGGFRGSLTRILKWCRGPMFCEGFNCLFISNYMCRIHLTQIRVSVRTK